MHSCPDERLGLAKSEISPLPTAGEMFQLDLIFLFYLFFLFAIFWAAPVAYGGSQARGPIVAVATGLR